jgi:Uma2 family endonuclease
MSDATRPNDEFTPEERARIQAHIRARGMTFEVFLPESLANWLRAKLTEGVFSDTKEAAFVAFQDLRDLDEQPQIREQLLNAVTEDRLGDQRPGIPAEQWIEAQRARWRRWAETETPVNTNITPARMRISVDRYQKMIETGVLNSSDRVELIEGDIVSRAPLTPRHGSVTAHLSKRFILELGDAALVRPLSPVDLGDLSEPEPDLCIVKPQPDDYAEAHPRADDVLLLVEIADTSLALDLGLKRDLYARFGVCEYWVVDLIHERIVVHQQPVHGAFQRTCEYGVSESIFLQSFPTIKISVGELFAR